LREPVTTHETVQWPEDQALGATRRTRYDANVLGLQAVFTDVRQRYGASVDVEGLHVAIF
jgi:hypothetical protein